MTGEREEDFRGYCSLHGGRHEQCRPANRESSDSVSLLRQEFHIGTLANEVMCDTIRRADVEVENLSEQALGVRRDIRSSPPSICNNSNPLCASELS
jgi:hypothetical protein